MILPPFYGFSTKYAEKYIYHVIHDYLSADILTYTDPTLKTIVSYLNADILTYNSVLSEKVYHSYLVNDILCYNLESNRTSPLSYLTCDVLCYELPPSEPKTISSVFARDKDSLGVLSWTEPDNGKSTITDYIIQYKQTGDISWITYSDGVGSAISGTVPLTNNNTYHFQVAAVNNIGTGEFTLSNSIIPSGGVDNDCDLIMYTNLDSTDRNFILITGCYGIDTIYATDYVATGVLGSGAFSNYWQFPGTLTTLTNNPHIGFTTFPHMHVVQKESSSWSLNGNFTLSLWFKPNSGSPTSPQTLLSCSSESGNNHSWKIYHHANKIAFATGNKGNLFDIVIATGLSVSTSSFTHIAVSRSNNYISCFINGIEKDEQYHNASLVLNSDYLIIGAYPRTDGYDFSSSDGWGLTTEGFSGGLDEIIVSKSPFYRGSFNIPTSARDTILDCGNCLLPGSPGILQVSYIED